MTLAPQGRRPPLPDLLFVKHYRVESNGWKNSGNCDDCVEHHKEILLPFNACDLTTTCACTFCTRQPASLADCARHILFHYTHHLDRFRLETHTTYDQYVYAVSTNRVPQADLLPPEAPTICVWYLSNIDSPLRFYRDCLGAGPWLNQSERKYSSSEEQMRDFVTYRNHFWCHHCDKGLLFPRSCVEHTDTIQLHDDDANADADDVVV